MHERLADLAAAVLRADPAQPVPIPRVGLHVVRAAGPRSPSIYHPRLCVILQGAKDMTIGERRLRYDTASYFVTSLDVPVTGCIVGASPECPYVAVTLALDGDALAELIVEAEGPGEPVSSGFAVAAMTDDMLDAWTRMLALLDRPAEIGVLAPLIEREILYRLLQGPHGGLIRQAVRIDSRLSRVRAAIAWLRTHYAEPVSVEALAGIATMSVASFHRHFRTATAMSPLQYQKALRLQEARRLLIASSDAGRAAHAVGYESASQFSREYARMFGAPPARDAARLRSASVAA